MEKDHRRPWTNNTIDLAVVVGLLRMRKVFFFKSSKSHPNRYVILVNFSSQTYFRSARHQHSVLWASANAEFVSALIDFDAGGLSILD